MNNPHARGPSSNIRFRHALAGLRSILPYCREGTLIPLQEYHQKIDACLEIFESWPKKDVEWELGEIAKTLKGVYRGDG